MFTKTTLAAFAASLALTADAAFAQDSEAYVPRTSDLIADQSLVALGDKAYVTFVQFEDITVNFDGACPSACTIHILMKDGVVEVDGVVVRHGFSASTIIVRGSDGTEVFRAADQEEFNDDLLRTLRLDPEIGIATVEPVS